MRIVSSGVFLAVAAVILAAEPRFLRGSHHELPADAPENQVLLNLLSEEIGDTDGATFGDAIKQNEHVSEQLERLTAMPYLSTYKVDLSDKRCPFEDDTATCANRQCAIEPLSSNDINQALFESQFLGRLRKNSVSMDAPADPVEGCAPDSLSLYAFDNYSDRDYCYPEDEDDADGVWVDLTGNSERFTGYAGHHANLMWEKVYGENCFGYPPRRDDDSINTSGSAADRLTDILAHPHKNVERDAQDDDAAGSSVPLPETECVEQRLFYRLLSGMHASISTHLCYDYYNATSETWEANLPEWLERVGWHEDRLNNLFFDYVLMSRAVSKLITTYEDQLSFSRSCEAVDTDVRVALKRLGRYLRQGPLATSLDESVLFASDEGQALKNEFRQRVRNVNALMSCVGCERCRLWGKIQTAGYGTALKILFELPQDPSSDPKAVAEVLSTFRRSELVALINTFARISHSVQVTDIFLSQSEARLIDLASFGYQISKGLQETKEAMAFIFRSYIDLPKNLARLALLQMHILWGRFVGRNDHQLATELRNRYEPTDNTELRFEL